MAGGGVGGSGIGGSGVGGSGIGGSGVGLFGGGVGFLLDPESLLFVQAPRETSNIKMIKVFIELSPYFDDGLVRGVVHQFVGLL